MRAKAVAQTNQELLLQQREKESSASSASSLGSTMTANGDNASKKSLRSKLRKRLSILNVTARSESAAAAAPSYELRTDEDDDVATLRVSSSRQQEQSEDFSVASTTSASLSAFSRQLAARCGLDSLKKKKKLQRPEDQEHQDDTTTYNAEDLDFTDGHASASTGLFSTTSLGLLGPVRGDGRVQFDLSANQVFFRKTRDTDKIIKARWYCADDIQRMMTQTDAFAKQINTEQGLEANASPNSYGRVLRSLYLACSQQTSDDDTSPSQQRLLEKDCQRLQCWIRDAPNYVGMDTLAIDTVVRNRAFRRTKLIKLVLEASAESAACRERNVSTPQDEDKASELAIKSRQTSRPALVFAQMLAKAQAQV